MAEEELPYTLPELLRMESGALTALGLADAPTLMLEAANEIERLTRTPDEAMQEALSWAEGHDPWLVDRIRERAASLRSNHSKED